jgi:2-polyprenyl-3-methyl-5-hydroxy-6-metoxy-1,4-benzoquinol methylase
MPSSTESIETFVVPECHVCGSAGESLYNALPDRLFGASGLWNIVQCANPDCRLLWLNPAPTETDIIKAYHTYYTHHDDVELSRRKQWMQSIYLENKYRYPSQLTFIQKLIGGIALLDVTQLSWFDAQTMYLPYQSNGKVIEVGCGSGGTLARMASHGWQVEGVDLDPAAVQRAREKGLKVHVGTLEGQSYANNSFDAVTMSHLIEHVHDPRKLLLESYRILKPGGTLVVLTPNNLSIGHRLFRKDWRGLEPPRHIHVFNIPSILRLMNEVGFTDIKASTSVRAASAILWASYRVATKDHFNPNMRLKLTERLLAKAMQWAEWIWLRFRPLSGEEMALVARKPT